MGKIRVLLVMLAVLFVVAGCSRDNDRVSSELPVQSSAPTMDAVKESPSTTNGSNNSVDEPSPSLPPVESPSSEPTKAVDGARETAPTKSATPSPSVTPNPKTPSEPDVVTPAVDMITISVEGNAEWGTIIAAENVVLAKGDTAASVLKRVAKAHRLSYEIEGSGTMTYIEGIDGLFEFDDGPLSGWKYQVNGIVADIGAGAYKLEPGDQLEWFYTSEDEAAKEDKESAS